MQEVPTMLTIREAADKSRISYDQISKWCKTGKVEFKLVGKTKRLVNWEKFVEFLNTPDNIENEAR